MGHLFAHAVAQKAHKAGILDFKSGFNLFRSPDVSAWNKLSALSIGGIFTALLLAVEMPLDLVLGVVVPFVGPMAELVVDGAEVVLVPMLIASAVLPHLVRRRERAVVRVQ